MSTLVTLYFFGWLIGSIVLLGLSTYTQSSSVSEIASVYGAVVLGDISAMIMIYALARYLSTKTRAAVLSFFHIPTTAIASAEEKLRHGSLFWILLASNFLSPIAEIALLVCLGILGIQWHTFLVNAVGSSVTFSVLMLAAGLLASRTLTSWLSANAYLFGVAILLCVLAVYWLRRKRK